jgi:glycosyltransferase involved in cell wall biosynthesis
MKVTHVITTIARGGAENQLKVLIAEQIQRGHKVEVVYLKGEPELRIKLESLGAVVNNFLVGRRFLTQLFFLRIFFKHNSGIIHAHLPRAELISALSNPNRNLIVSRHNAEPFFPKAPKFVSILLSRLVEKKCQRLVVISKAVKEYLVSNREIVDKSKVELVYYGFDPDIPNRSERPFNSSVEFRIGTIGRLTNQKDYPTLFEAFKLFLKTHTKAKLFIVGGGELETELKELANEIGIDSNVVWVGRTDDVHTWLSKMDLFVLASKYEGFGLVLLEAIQAGVPVLASNNSAIPEVLGSGSAGLFRTGDSRELFEKINFYEDEKNRQLLVNEQRQRLQFFTPSRMILEMDQIYFEVSRTQ